MALVKSKDYNGNLIAKTVLEALEMIGVVNKLNINGYHISIIGSYNNTSKDIIDDTPSVNTVIIDRNKFIKNCNKAEFKEIKSDINNIDAILSEQEEYNLDFIDSNNKEITHEISHDQLNYLWYKHKIEFTFSKSILETNDTYIKRIFEDIADYVISTFEYMEDTKGEN